MNFFRFAFSCLIYTATLSAAPVDKQVKAFEGAEGFGAYSSGGRGGEVIKVTDLSDNVRNPAPGSLRWALEQHGPRIVEFDIEGTITLEKPLVITNPFITVDGSTAPGIGVTIKDYGLEISNTHDVIVRHLRVRPGDEAILAKPPKQRSGGTDALLVANSSNVIIDHCSASWTSDTVASVDSSSQVTLQYCFFYEPLANPEVHYEKGKPQSHAHVSNVSGDGVSYIKNVLAYYGDLGIQINDDMDGCIEAVNNYCYAYTESGSLLKPVANKTIKWHMVSNFYERALGKRGADIEFTPGGVLKGTIGKKSKVYLSDNIGPLRNDPASDQWTGTSSKLDPVSMARIRSDDPLFSSNVKVISTDDLKDLLLSEGGATLPKRDSNDLRIVKQIKTGKGKTTVNSQNDVGGYREFSP